MFFLLPLAGVDISQENGGASSQAKPLKGQSKQKSKKRHGYDSANLHKVTSNATYIYGS